jgi:hypothetical protein
MSDFERQVIQSWDEFISSVREMASSNSSEVRRWLYRGEPKAQPLLCASRTRVERLRLSQRAWGAVLCGVDANEVDASLLLAASCAACFHCNASISSSLRNTGSSVRSAARV